jgi:hypothetical protein
MRLISRTGATAVDDNGKHYTAADDLGSFDFPEDVGARLHSFHAGGKPLWETQIEQQHRLIGEEAERRKDPATLLTAVEALVAAAKSTRPAEPVAPAARTAPKANPARVTAPAPAK